jgi:hypothetical protein
MAWIERNGLANEVKAINGRTFTSSARAQFPENFIRASRL